MRVFSVDLYEHFALPLPEGAAGTLTCYIQDTPAGQGKLRPAMLVLPGGGYCHVSPREGEPIAQAYLAKGYHAFVLEYSVFPARFPVALREAAMAMAYIRGNTEAFAIRKVAAVGFSAGGHLCGSLGMLFDCPEVADIAPAHVLRPDVLGLCYPVTVSYQPTHGGSFDSLCGDDAALRSRLSLDSLVRPDMPPVYLWHTREDDCVPCVGTLILAQRLVEQGIDCALHLYHRGWHGLATADAQTNDAHGLVNISADVSGWIDEFALFLEEKGFAITSHPAE